MAASLRPDLARIVAEIYLEERNWYLVRKRILTSNALQARTTGSAIRMEREMRQRLRELTESQLTLLANGTVEDSVSMSWVAVIKHVSFVFEFTLVVLEEKLAAHDPVLRPSDYESFFEGKTITHPELNALTPSSRYKIRQILLRMLIEAGLLAQGEALGVIRRPALSQNAAIVIAADDSKWFTGFLVPATEIENDYSHRRTARSSF